MYKNTIIIMKKSPIQKILLSFVNFFLYNISYYNNYINLFDSSIFDNSRLIINRRKNCRKIAASYF